MRIYVASSWRNEYYDHIIKHLRSCGDDVLDWRAEEPFRWSEMDQNYMDWSSAYYANVALKDPRTARGFLVDYQLMKQADACLLLTPCGRSAHLELGWFIGAGKRAGILLTEKQEPELMYLLAPEIFLHIDEVIEAWMP